MADVVRPEFGVHLGGVQVPLLGLWGLSESGKTTVANLLDDHYGFIPFSMGLLIGDLVARGEGLWSADEQLDADTYLGMKAQIPGFHQKLVTYGGAVRKLLGQEVLTRAAADWIQTRRHRGHPVVFENVRVESEYNLIRSLGGRMVEVERPQTRAFSELDLILADRMQYPMAYKLANSGTEVALGGRVHDMLEELFADDGSRGPADHGGTPGAG